MSKLITLVLVFLVIGCSTNKQILSKKAFTDEYLKALSKKYPDIDFDTSERPLFIEGKGKNTIYILDSYRQYEAEPNKLKQIVRKSTNRDAFIYGKKEREIHTNFIIPIIKSKDYFKKNRSSERFVNKFKRNKILWERYNSDLIIIYAINDLFRTRFLKRNEFKNLNISQDTLLNFSLNNLNKRITRIGASKENEYLQLISNNENKASLILIDHIWKKENFGIEGDIVIAIPNENSLFIADSQNEIAIERLKVVLQNKDTSGNLISKNLYKWNGIKFERYQK